MIKNLSKIILLITLCIFSQASFCAEEWSETKAEFKVDVLNIKDLELKNTLIGALVDASEQTIESLLETDKKSLVTFCIKYKAELLLKGATRSEEKIISQHGLYRTLDPKLQNLLEGKQVAKIRFAKSDPVLIEFIENGEAIPAPALATDIIDASWQKKE